MFVWYEIKKVVSDHFRTDLRVRKFLSGLD